MPDTYTLLEKVTVGSGGASSITFTSIPQSYTDLVIKISARTTASAETGSFMRFNGSSAANYAYLQLRGDGSTTTSTLATNQTETFPGRINDNAYTANTFSNGEVYIPNYSGSTNKCISVDAVTENNATTAQMGLVAGLRAITDPITSILIAPSGGNWAQHSTFYLYGVAKQGVTPLSAPKATGGDIIVSDGTYWIHTFLSSGTFRPLTSLTCDYLVVAGGGGGGSGGGGAGGLRCTVTATGGGGSLESALALLANTNYTITVGAGGNGALANSNGASGSDSSISGSGITTVTSTGGGGGGGAGGGSGLAGGSGGGGYGGGIGGTRTINQGFNGGNGASQTAGGGGGGAGVAGNNASASDNGGKGGNGVATSISGSSVTYAGGGGGGANSSGTVGGAGTGGGGTGGKTGNSTAGTANTGGGGGGDGVTPTIQTAKAGGSGIVIVRYAV